MHLRHQGCLLGWLACLLISTSVNASLMAKPYKSPCLKELIAADIPGQAEIKLITELSPHLVTYPFVDQDGHQILVVFYHKFPFKSVHIIKDAPTAPKSLKERYLAFRHRHPDFYYFDENDFKRIHHPAHYAPGDAGTKIHKILTDPTWAVREFRERDQGRLAKAKVVLLPFLRPYLIDARDPENPEQLDLSRQIRQEHLRWTIDVMKKLGHHSLMSEVIEKAMQDLIQEEYLGDWPQAIEWRVSSRIHVGRYYSITNKILQLLVTTKGEERVFW